MPPYSGIVIVDGTPVHWQTTFDDSLKFKCVGCGYSCTASNVEVSPQELLGINGLGVRDFTEPFDGGQRVRGSDSGPCLLLTAERRCSVYSHRPLPCQLYPFRIVPLSPHEVRIDATYGCTAMLTGAPGENEADFPGMVAAYLSDARFDPAKHQGAMLREAVKDSMDKELAWKRCWQRIIGELLTLDNFERLWDALDCFEKARTTLSPLTRGDADAYIEASLAAFRARSFSLTPYDPAMFLGSHTRPYHLYDLGAQESYYLTIKNGELSMRSSGRHDSVPLASIPKLRLSPEARDFLSQYLSRIWDRQSIRQRIEEMTLSSSQPSFSLQLAWAKRKCLLLAFLLDAIAHFHGHERIELSDAQESLFAFDMVFLYA